MRYGLRHIRGFVTLAEELHFGRASARLNTTQPGLSRLIAELEREVETTLFRRTTRSVELTEAGKAFLIQSQLGLEHFERAASNARRTAAGMSGSLRIGYMDFAINGRLPEFFNAFSRYRPDIHIELSFMGSAKQHEALLADKIDVGFMIGPFQSENMTSYKFDTDNYVALLPITHALAKVRNLRLSDIATEPFILGSGEHWRVFREQLFAICHRSGFQPNIVQEASSSDGIFGLVAAGAGVSIYAGCVRNILRRGVTIRLLDDVPDHISTFAVWPLPLQSPSLDVFASFLTGVWGRGSGEPLRTADVPSECRSSSQPATSGRAARDQSKAGQ